MSPSSSPIKGVPAWKLQLLFNSSQYPGLIINQRLEKIVLKSKLMQEPNLTQKGLPPGTKSEVIVYRNRAKDLYVKVHQYLLPNGTIGASGKPDPKAMKLNGVMYVYSEKFS